VETAVVVGNPKPMSRTLAAARIVAEGISGTEPAVVIDVVTLGPGLLGWGDPAVVAAIEAIQSVDAVVVASPTYKASYTGLLKLFLDQIPADGLSGIVAVPLMLGAGTAHALAPEIFLKPVLVELGAVCPTRALYMLDGSYEDEGQLAPWLSVSGPQIAAALGAVAR
jgi:FMN reductase